MGFCGQSGAFEIVRILLWIGIVFVYDLCWIFWQCPINFKFQTERILFPSTYYSDWYDIVGTLYRPVTFLR